MRLRWLLSAFLLAKSGSISVYAPNSVRVMLQQVLVMAGRLDFRVRVGVTGTMRWPVRFEEIMSCNHDVELLPSVW